MSIQEHSLTIVQELRAVMERLTPEAGNALCDRILGAERIFVAGAGRSGLAARGFAMRLMHLGLAAYVCGEIATPGMKAEDLLIVISGSGETGSLVSMAKKAKSLGGSLALVTVRPESTIGCLADAVVQVPAPTPKAACSFRSVQPMGSLFEQSCFLLLDAVVMELMPRLGEQEDSMFARHANLE